MDYCILLLLISLHLGCAGLLWASIWPGLSEEIISTLSFVAIFLGIFIVPVIALIFLLRWLYNHWYIRRTPPRLFDTEAKLGSESQQSQKIVNPRKIWLKRLALSAIALFFITHILLKIELPRKWAFHLVRPVFEAELLAIDTAQPWTSTVGKKIGLYWIPEYQVFEQGGVYFKTGKHGFAFLDTYGFVYQPNSNTSPFGNDPYVYFPLVDDWYWFQAGNRQM